MTSDKMDESKELQEAENRSAVHDVEDIDCPNIRHVIIDFGECPVYGQYVKNFPLENLENTEGFCYEIMRNHDFNPIYRVFNFNKYEGMIKPGDHLKLKVIYNPTIPYLRDVENFEFVDSSFNIIKIKLIGNCIGPILKASVKQLDFLIATSEKSVLKTVELKNVSDVHAEFIFDYIEENSVFKVEPSKGTIKGHRHIYIHIIFKPKHYGSYSEQLYCLVWGGDPVLIQLRGVYKAECHDISALHFQSYSLPFKSTFGYTAYLQDCSNIKISMPPVSMSRNYIDFGRILKSDMNSSIEFITLRNNLENNVIVKWPDDNVYKIIPKKATILPTMKASFKCNFYPDSKNKLYSKMLTAQIKWMPKSVHGVVLPIPVTIKLQGHSFPENEYWIPKVEVCPQIITLPPCVPGDPSHTSFKITILGHLPVMYKLIPPKKTNFVMKPVVGIVRTYQIVVVQLYWEGTEETKMFKEVWFIELNDRKEKRIPICIRGEVSVPKIVVGERNVIKFESNQPGCQSIASVPLKNISCYQIIYKFENKEYDFIDIFPKEAIISPNDMIYIKCSYVGSLDHPKEIKLKCKLQRIKKMVELVGTAYSHTFTVLTNCRYQELCSTPTHHNFGEVQLDTFLETEFYLFNFGKWNVSFSLKVVYGTNNLDCFKIEPLFGDIGPKQKIRIHVTGLAETLGDRIITITYSNKTDGQLKKSINQEESNRVFEMHYVAVLSILQIESIMEHNFGPLFSKKHLWDYLKIEQLNNYLRNMSRGERLRHCVYLPEVQISEETYFITIVMESKSVYETDVRLERKQLCECSLKEVAVNINTTKRKFDCIHRKMLCMQLTGTKFYENTQQLLTITIRYLLSGETQMCYILQLPHDRNIEISFLIYSIPIDTFKMSCYNTEFRMDLKNISVRRKVPPIQICWFYNNTGQPAIYQMNMTNILYLCQREGYEILKCINPDGIIDPYSALPLMIRFQPVEIKEYVVSTSIICGDQVHNFYIKGNGQGDINKNVYQSQIPSSSKKYCKLHAVLSPDYIPINSIPIWSTTERVIFIKNTSKDKMFQYFWEEVGINNIVELTATNKLGILQPQESQAVVIKIKTFNEACLTSLQLSCHFLDYTQLILHQKFLEESVKRQLQNKEGNEGVCEENITIKHPKPFTKTIVISLQIIHTNDRDNFFTPKKQFESNPNDQIDINVSDVLKSQTTYQIKEELTIRSQDKVKIQTILEQLIADFVFSNYLQEVLEYLSKLSSSVYEHFTLDERQVMEKKKNKTPLSIDDLQKFELKQIKKLFTRPKPNLVSQVSKDLIINGIHDIFKLGIFKPVETHDTEETKSAVISCSTGCTCKKTIKKM